MYIYIFCTSFNHLELNYSPIITEERNFTFISQFYRDSNQNQYICIFRYILKLYLIESFLYCSYNAIKIGDIFFSPCGRHSHKWGHVLRESELTKSLKRKLTPSVAGEKKKKT